MVVLSNVGLPGSVIRSPCTSTTYIEWLYAVNKRKIFPTCRVHSFFVSATMRYVLPIIAINMFTINSAPRIINRKNMIYDKTTNKNKTC